MTRRIFFGIPIEENLQEKIAAWRKKYERLAVRWVKPNNLHVTLIPPWDEEDIDSVIRLLEHSTAKAVEPLTLQFTRVAYGPSLREPRLIWAEGVAPHGLLTLKNWCESVLGVSADTRPFLLHLTLARFRPETFSSFPVKKLDESVSWSQTCSSVVLYESNLLPGGAEYTVLFRRQL
ncbi:RNA 2',3'-cyclic phosphodiesterase [Candidatus Uhrbacteria bacterium]|nr:RNA 2',3'-cyclic phosphodiesterase [Candidatus Uhrbacteria bacterium]